jgi:hypothetical protein
MSQPLRSPFEGFAQLDAAQLDVEQQSAAKARRSLLHRVRAKVVPLGARRCGSASSLTSTDASVSHLGPNWEDLPAHLLEKILGCLLEDATSNSLARRVRGSNNAIDLRMLQEHFACDTACVAAVVDSSVHAVDHQTCFVDCSESNLQQLACEWLLSRR